jgi:hypothetical protein
MEFALMVLSPPSNIDRLIGELQEQLFSELGLASALALPVMLPLLYLPVEQAEGFFKQALKETEHSLFGFRIASLDLTVVKEEGEGSPVRTNLFFKTDVSSRGEGILSGMQAVGERAVGSAGEAVTPFHCNRPLPLFRYGFFLGQAGTSVPDPLPVNPPPAFRFSIFTYELLKFSVADPPRPWYSEVHWEVAARQEVRRPR